MSAASSIGLFICPMEMSPKTSNSTMVLNPYALNALNDTESRSNLLEINQENVYTKPQNITKLQQFMPNDLNNIQSEMLDKPLNKISSKREEDLFFLQDDNDSLADLNRYSNEIKEACSHPEYLVFTWVLCLIALATGLKLYYLVKTFMAAIMVCCYAILISFIFPEVFENASTGSEDNAKYGMPLTARMNILLIVFLTMVTYHARLVEVTSRLDFVSNYHFKSYKLFDQNQNYHYHYIQIWKEQAEKELSNMKSNRVLNDLLIKVSLLIYVIHFKTITRTFKYLLPSHLFRIYFLTTSLVTTYLMDVLTNSMQKCIICVELCLHRFQTFKIFILKILKMEKHVFEF